MRAPTPRELHRIYDLKRALLDLRRGIWPQREVVNSLVRDEDLPISDSVRVYLRDCYDHVVQLIDGVETYRELAGNLMDMYLSSVSNRTNEVMKTLTIMASIFIPLTFIAGIYGMNFENMPELHASWGYPLVWLAMSVTAIGMLLYFYRLGWIDPGGRGTGRESLPRNGDRERTESQRGASGEEALQAPPQQEGEKGRREDVHGSDHQ